MSGPAQWPSCHARASQGGFCYHLLNQDNGRRTVFHNKGDYAAFLKLLAHAAERTPVWLLPNAVEIDASDQA
jgi:hypothetical protein